MISGLISKAAEIIHDQAQLFLEFEEVVVVAIGFMIFLMWAFYIKWPYNKDLN